MSSVSRRSMEEPHRYAQPAYREGKTLSGPGIDVRSSVTARGSFEDLSDEVNKTHCPNGSEDRLFINVTGTTVSGNPGVRQSIRRHVMKHFRRAQKVEKRGRDLTPSPPPAFGSQRSLKRKSPRQPPQSTTKILNTEAESPEIAYPATTDLVTWSPGKSSLESPQSQESSESDSSAAAAPPQEYKIQDSQTSVLDGSTGQWINRYLAGYADPFVQYPTAVSSRTRRLLAHVFDDDSANIKPYRDAFFAVALLDAATFHQYLANFALYLPNVRSLPAAEEYEKTEALVHQDKAIKLIIKKMGNRKDVVSDGMIGAVVGMACQAHMLQDIPLWRAHMDGLKTMIRLRGGVDTLNTNPVLRKAFTWLDINSSSTQDRAPLYELPLQFVKYKPPIPLNIIPSPQVEAISRMWRKTQPEHTELSELLIEIDQFFSYLLERSIQTSRRVWMDSNFAGGFVNPYLYRLLHFRSAVVPEDKKTGLTEAFRLGLMLSLAEPRRAFGIYPVVCHTHITKLRLLIEAKMLDWNELADLGLWVTAMGLLEAMDQDRNCFVVEWGKMLKRCGFISTEEAEMVLRNLPWIDELHGRKLRRILS